MGVVGLGLRWWVGVRAGVWVVFVVSSGCPVLAARGTSSGFSWTPLTVVLAAVVALLQGERQQIFACGDDGLLVYSTLKRMRFLQPGQLSADELAQQAAALYQAGGPAAPRHPASAPQPSTRSLRGLAQPRQQPQNCKAPLPSASPPLRRRCRRPTWRASEASSWSTRRQ